MWEDEYSPSGNPGVTSTIRPWIEGKFIQDHVTVQQQSWNSSWSGLAPKLSSYNGVPWAGLRLPNQEWALMWPEPQEEPSSMGSESGKDREGWNIPPFPLFFGLSMPQPPGSPPPAEVVVGAAAAGSPGAQSVGERNLPSNQRSCCSSRREGRAPPASLFSLASLHSAQDADAVIGSSGWSRVTVAPGPTRRCTEIRKYNKSLFSLWGSQGKKGSAGPTELLFSTDADS